jgi:hypothetical protein
MMMRSWVLTPAESAVSTDAPAQAGPYGGRVSADDAAVMVVDPSLASATTAALASIRLQLGTAEHHLRQALERGARLRDRMARAAGGEPPPGSVLAVVEYPALAEAEASIERARAARGALAP